MGVAAAPPPPQGAPLALYIHWPFCASKCPYCDFNSHVRERIDEARFRDALLAELAWEAGRLGPRALASIFFGGGTPSLMDPASVAALITAATRHFAPAEDVEITLEANPSSVEVTRLAEFAAAGINRISLGVQALDDSVLRFLGRRHDAGQALAALSAARTIFARASFDMIYARPGQAPQEWRRELGQALALGFDHLSLYQLTIEPGTAFATAHARGEFVLPDSDAAALLYEATAEEAARFGLAAYEISNYARPGAESRHNLAYWRYHDYAGIGPGAHGRVSIAGGANPLPGPPPPAGEGVPVAPQRLTSPSPAGGGGPGRGAWPPGNLLATRRHRAPEAWAGLVEAHGHGTTEETPVAPADRAREALLMGLRLTEGIDAEPFLARTGTRLADALDPAILGAAIDEDYLNWDGSRLVATRSGLIRLDALLPRLVL